MSESKQDHPTPDSVNRLNTLLWRMVERLRESTKFKPGELTQEEEEFVQRKGLNALNYIPQKTLAKQSEAFQEYEEKMRKRAEIMSRPRTDPERVQIETDERARKFHENLKDRFDRFGYGMFLLVVLAATATIIDIYGWPMGIFSGLLMLAVLELSYRLHARD